MNCKKLIYFILLLILFVNCTSSSSDCNISEEELYINFFAETKYDVSVDVGTRTVESTSTLGLFGFLASQSDSIIDFWQNVEDNDFCQALYNSKYFGTFPGQITPVESELPSFPINANSAIATYAYSPYCDSVVIDDNSCYIEADIFENRLATDYRHSGKVFKTKTEYKNDGMFRLPMKHSFARVNLRAEVDLSSLGHSINVLLDSIEFIFDRSGKGLFNIKTGEFISCADSIDDNNVCNILSSSLEFSSSKLKHQQEIYLPEDMKPIKIRLIGHIARTTLSFNFDIDVPNNKLNIQQGYLYDISIKFNPLGTNLILL